MNSALYYYRARTYDPKVGRFLQADPIPPRPEEMNAYVYVGNNVVNRIDPSGLMDFMCCLSNCIQAFDPFSSGGKGGLYLIGGPIPKNWLPLPRIGSPYTSLPSWLGLGQGVGNLWRLIGRGGSAGFLIYGNYLFLVELYCASECAE